MAQRLIHFAHGNGFPASTYRKYLSVLEQDYTISFIDTVGHTPQYPVTDNWNYLVQEQIDYIESLRQPVIGVGHSLGGGLLYMAALQRPDLFTAIVALDSPLYGMVKSGLIWLAKRLNLIDKITAAQRTQYRRDQWPHHEAMCQYLQTKDLFQRFDPDCLMDYAVQGTLPHTQGVQLKFKRHIEAEIFRTVPHDFYRHNQPLAVPFGYLYGENSSVITLADRRRLMKDFRAVMQAVPGGHLFPFQYPLLGGQLTSRLITELCAENS